MRATYALLLAMLAAYWLPMMPLSREGAWWHLWAYALSHGGPWHLALNAAALLGLGLGVERKVGPARLVALYGLCVATAGLGHLLMSASPVVGASGGILGLAGAYAVLYPEKRLWLLGLVPMRAGLLVGLYAVATFACGLLGLLPGIAHWAHLGGIAAGVVIGTQLNRSKR